jgi:hypothetical protein
MNPSRVLTTNRSPSTSTPSITNGDNPENTQAAETPTYAQDHLAATPL